jgi:two-component system, chemotaxis family, chemotaxis protein CheY
MDFMSLFQKIRVILIDDDESTRQIMEFMLRRLGVGAIFHANDGRDGFDVLNRLDLQLPDLILCDLYMPNIDGFSFVERLRASANKFHASLPVLILTGKTDEQTVKAGLKLGIDGFLVKPVSPELLQRRMTKIFAARGIEPFRSK